MRFSEVAPRAAQARPKYEPVRIQGVEVGTNHGEQPREVLLAPRRVAMEVDLWHLPASLLDGRGVPEQVAKKTFRKPLTWFSDSSTVSFASVARSSRDRGRPYQECTEAWNSA